MNRYIALLALLVGILAPDVFSAGLDTNAWGPITNNFQMSLVFTNGVGDIKTNQPFNLQISVRNLSTNGTVVILEGLGAIIGPGFAIQVLSPSGRDISPGPNKVLRGSGAMISVGPSQTREITFSLNDICKFDELGAYIISVRLNIGDKDRPCWVVSNALCLSVTPGEWKPQKIIGPRFGL